MWSDFENRLLLTSFDLFQCCIHGRQHRQWLSVGFTCRHVGTQENTNHKFDHRRNTDDRLKLFTILWDLPCVPIPQWVCVRIVGVQYFVRIHDLVAVKSSLQKPQTNKIYYLNNRITFEKDVVVVEEKPRVLIAHHGSTFFCQICNQDPQIQNYLNKPNIYAFENLYLI